MNRSSKDRPETAEPSRTPRHRILLVDDDATVLDSVQGVLVAEGFHVFTAPNGQRAIELARETVMDLVLLDLNMPVKNGWDTYEQLTREHPFLPVIITTARPNQWFTAVNAGVGALMEKPMDIATLLQTIRRLLAEPAQLHLARLAGEGAGFYYQSAPLGERQRAS